MERFQQRKLDVLGKKDKSFAGVWDEKVLGLCKKINSLDNYYTTSSCSGRVMIVKNQEKKDKDTIVFASHDLVGEYFLFETPSSSLNLPPRSTISPTLGEGRLKLKGDLKFKQEPAIFHVACESLEGAKALMKKALKVGWKRVGLISFDRNIIVEIAGTEKIEFPFMKNGKLLVSEEFMKEIIRKSNSNLERGWDKIKRLTETFK